MKLNPEYKITVIKLNNGELYRYKLKKTIFSSARFGSCEICKQYARTVFTLTEYKWDEADPEDDWEGGWLAYECERTKYGHKECLEKQMKNGIITSCPTRMIKRKENFKLTMKGELNEK
jgi:hypothetical protein